MTSKLDHEKWMSNRPDPEEQIGAIDTSLHYVGWLDGTSLVYKVSREGELFTLKMSPVNDEWGKGYTEWIQRHLAREQEVLGRTNEIDGVARLVEVYNPAEGQIALLKEYVEGASLDGRIGDRAVKDQLTRTVLALHRQGISKLDLERPHNVIISPERDRATLTDFGSCLLQGVDEEYERKRQEDKEYLVKLFI